MKIRYQPRHGAQRIEVRDIMGGHELATWHVGQERDIASGATVLFRHPDGSHGPMDAAQAVLSCGPDFVDATTGINPNFACGSCGDLALDDWHVDPATLDLVHYTLPNGGRACMTCFVASRPDLVRFFRERGLSRDIIDRAASKTAQRQFLPTRVSTAAPQVAQASREDEE